MPNPRTAVDAAPSHYFVRDDRVLWRSVGGRAVVFISPNGEIVTLRGAGARVWELLTRPQTGSELVQRLAHVYAIPAEIVRDDLFPVLGRLLDHEILRTVGTT